MRNMKNGNNLNKKEKQNTWSFSQGFSKLLGDRQAASGTRRRSIFQATELLAGKQKKTYKNNNFQVTAGVLTFTSEVKLGTKSLLRRHHMVIEIKCKLLPVLTAMLISTGLQHHLFFIRRRSNEF